MDQAKDLRTMARKWMPPPRKGRYVLLGGRSTPSFDGLTISSVAVTAAEEVEDNMTPSRGEEEAEVAEEAGWEKSTPPTGITFQPPLSRLARRRPPEGLAGRDEPPRVC